MTFCPPIKPLTNKQGFWERPPSVTPIPNGPEGVRYLCGVTWDKLRWRERLWYWRPRWAFKIPVLRYRVVFNRVEMPELK